MHIATKENIVKRISEEWSTNFKLFRKLKPPMVQRMLIYRMAWCVRIIRRLALSDGIKILKIAVIPEEKSRAEELQELEWAIYRERHNPKKQDKLISLMIKKLGING